ncbi:hypothetical protein SAMN05421757_102836 [Tropicimonas sediminicola]|uniref:Uncharacterized protein n=1 Tax=Tropicimonas sediminicola TaxID=1031541 RepID=A0A239FUC3_9RHOB|nr:hypothetical protein SAMN05421757_102836 [Tropicimonas sediminicola]
MLPTLFRNPPRLNPDLRERHASAARMMQRRAPVQVI